MLLLLCQKLVETLLWFHIVVAKGSFCFGCLCGKFQNYNATNKYTTNMGDNLYSSLRYLNIIAIPLTVEYVLWFDSPICIPNLDHVLPQWKGKLHQEWWFRKRRIIWYCGRNKKGREPTIDKPSAVKNEEGRPPHSHRVNNINESHVRWKNAEGGRKVGMIRHCSLSDYQTSTL